MSDKPYANVTFEDKPTRCQDCLLMLASMDGPYCRATNIAVYPEGRNGIHPSCPFLIKPK